MFSKAVKYVKKTTVPLIKTRDEQVIRAIKNKDNDLLRTLLAKGFSPNSVQEKEAGVLRRKSALRYAMEYLNLEAIDILLNAPGINVDLPDIEGFTPLMIASLTNNNIDLLNKLLEKGADVRLRDDEGNSALFYAAATFSINNTHFLLSRGAPLNLPNNQGFTPLTYTLDLNKNSDTVDENYLNTIHLLLEYGAELGNALDIDNRPEVLAVLSNDPKSRPPTEARIVEDVPTGYGEELTDDEPDLLHLHHADASLPTNASFMYNEEEEKNGGKTRRIKKYKNKSIRRKNKNKKGKQYKNKSIRRKK